MTPHLDTEDRAILTDLGFDPHVIEFVADDLSEEDCPCGALPGDRHLRDCPDQDPAYDTGWDPDA